MPSNVLIVGANGAMGQVLSKMIAKTEDLAVAAGIDLFPDKAVNPYPVFKAIEECDVKVDLIIDFSRPASLPANLAYAKERKLPILIATTGFSPEEKAEIAAASEFVPVFFTANMSLGVNVQMELCRQAAGFFGKGADIEIIERHHNLKADAPSGTALMLGEAINEERNKAYRFQFGRKGNDSKRQPDEIGFHSIRGGRIAGDHEVLFISDAEILEIRHHAESKEVFGAGAIRAARFLLAQPNGLYSMHDIVAGSKAVTSLSASEGEAIITLKGFPADPRAMGALFSAIARRGVVVDIISQSIPQGGRMELTFSIEGNFLRTAEDCVNEYGFRGDVVIQSSLAKVIVEGIGMEKSPGVAAKLMGALALHGMEVLLITTSDNKISFCVPGEQKEAALTAAREAFPIHS